MTDEKILTAIRAELEDQHEIVTNLLKERRIISDDRNDLRNRYITLLERLKESRAQCMKLAQELDDIKRAKGMTCE